MTRTRAVLWHHTWHHDAIDNVTSKSKWCASDAACPKCVKTKLPKNKATNARQGPPRAPGGPPDATPSPTYLGASLWLEPTTTLFTLCYNAALGNYFTNLHKGGWGGPPTPLAQRASTSESHTCTSTASCDDPGSCRVECTGERPLTVVLESDHGSSKARGCSSSIMATHSHNHHHGLISTSVLPCPHIMPLDGGSGFTFTHPSISLCSSPLVHHPPACCLPPASAHLPPRRNRWSSPGGGGSRAPWCSLPPGGCMAQNLPMQPPSSPPPS